MARASQVALVAATSLLVACDVVQGFEHAGDALFPTDKTYLDVPGYRLTPGHFRYLDMVTTTEPFILARSASDGDDALYSMHFQSPHPCAVPHVASYWTGGSPDSKRTYLAYFDGSDASPLRFSDLDCAPLDYTLDGASLPVGSTESGLVVPVGSELYDVNPAAGTRSLLASDVTKVDAGRHLVLAGGKLGVFDASWRAVEWVGTDVVRLVPAFDEVFYEDAGGVEQLTESHTGGRTVVRTRTLVAGACELTALPETPHLELLGFRLPCESGALAVWDAGTSAVVPLDVAADPGSLLLESASPGSHPDLATEPYFALYLAAPTGDTGTLMLQTPDGTLVQLGEHAALERAELEPEPGGSAIAGGFALIDVSGGNGRFVHFELDGTETDIASNVVREPASDAWTRLVIDRGNGLFDLAEVVGDEAVTVAHDVPARGYASIARYSPLAGRMAWLYDVHGETGTLALAAPDPRAPVDAEGHEPLYAPEPVARDVFVEGHAFLGDLPGFVYFRHWDDAKGTGELTYSNVELGFSALVSEGVSDYLQPGSGVLYTVPFGNAAGIWLARGK